MGAALGMGWLLEPAVGEGFAVLPVAAVLLPLVVLVRPGPFLGGAIVGCTASWVAFVPPRMSGVVEAPGGVLLAVLFGTAVAAAAIAAWLSWRTRDRLRSFRREAEEGQEVLRVTLMSIGDAVITTDTRGRIAFLNDVAAELIGWSLEECVGKPLHEIFRIINEHTRLPAANPVDLVLKQRRVVGLANSTILVGRDGTERPIDDSAAPIRDRDGRIIGVVLVFRDITERRKSEHALRRNERELADFFDNAAVGLHWVGPDGTILRANQAELDMLGYTREEYVGRHIGEFHTEEDVIGDILTRLKCGETLNQYPAQLRCRDGSTRDVLISSSVLFEDGEFIHTRCFTLDVTERRLAEEALRDSEARLRAIFETAIDGIITIDEKGTIESANSAVERLFGYSAAELKGRNVNVLMPDPYRREHDSYLDNYRRTGQRRIIGIGREVVGQRKNGTQFPMDLAVSELSLGGRPSFTGVIRDITERTRAEEAMRRSEERLRAAQQAGGVGTFEWDFRSGTIIWTPELEALYGLPSNSFGGTYEAWATLIHPHDLHRAEADVREAMQSGEFESEWRVKLADGRIRWLEARGWAERDASGEVRRMLGVNLDITERKRHEEQMRTLMAELNHRVKNTLAVIQSMTQQTLRRSPNLEAFEASFHERLQAIATAHSLLTKTEWEGASLSDIISSEIQGRLASREQYTAAGPPVTLRPKAALAMHMVVHELTTNASKYGGLSSEQGRIRICWTVRDERDATLELVWSEHCACPVNSPSEDGYGSRLIDQLVEYELHGDIRRKFSSSGLSCIIRFPLAHSINPAPARIAEPS